MLDKYIFILQCHCTLYCCRIGQNKNTYYSPVSVAADYLPVPRGRRWSVNSSAWRWRQLCFLCWRRWHQTCWPASEDFAPKDRYLTPPSTCQPADGGIKTINILYIYNIKSSFTLFLLSLPRTYHFFRNVTNRNLIVGRDILLLRWK